MAWIAVCDGIISKIFIRDHRLDSLNYLASFTHSNEATHEHGRDRPGRNSQSAAAAHQVYEPRTDWHENQKSIFIKEICSFLLKKWEEHAFLELYFIAPEKLIGVFRENFEKLIPSQQKDKLKIHVLAKDLTHLSTEELKDTLLKEEGWK